MLDADPVPEVIAHRLHAARTDVKRGSLSHLASLGTISMLEQHSAGHVMPSRGDKVREAVEPMFLSRVIGSSLVSSE